MNKSIIKHYESMRNGMEVFIPFVSSYLNVTPPVLSIGFFEGVKTQQTHLQTASSMFYKLRGNLNINVLIAMTEFFLVTKSRCKAHLILWIYMVYPNIQTSFRHIFQIQWSDSEYKEDNSNFLRKTLKSSFPLHVWQDVSIEKKKAKSKSSHLTLLLWYS